MTKSIQKPIRMGFLSLSSMLAGGISRNIKKHWKTSVFFFDQMLTNVIRYPWCGIIGVECLGERDEKRLILAC